MAVAVRGQGGVVLVRVRRREPGFDRAQLLLRLLRSRASSRSASRRARWDGPRGFRSRFSAGFGLGLSDCRLAAADRSTVGSWSRAYSPNPPSRSRSRPFSIAIVRVASASISARSCETSSTVPGKGLERVLERLAALEVEVVRRLVEHEEVRARRDDGRARAAAARRPRARRPASRARPSPRRGTGRAAFCACGRVRPVVDCDAVEHDAALVAARPPAARSTPGSRRARADRPAGRAQVERLEQRRLPRAVRADQRHVLAALDRERDAVTAAACRPRPASSLRHSSTTRPLRGGVEELEAERALAACQRVELARTSARALREPVDVLQLACACLRLRLLVAEPLDEPLEVRDLRRRSARRPRPRRAPAPAFSRRQCVPLPREVDRAAAGRARARRSSPPRGTSGRARRGSRRRRAVARSPRATRGRRRRGGSSARRAAAGRARRRARAPARRASARRRRTSRSGRSRSASANPSPRTTDRRASRQS